MDEIETDVETLDGLDTLEHPYSDYLRVDRIPHVWCAGCGIGTSLGCFVRAMHENKTDTKKFAIVSGIGCSGRVAGYLNVDSFHTTHGRPIPFATGLKLANPELKVVVYSGDGDLFAIGGNHFIHAARRNMDLTVICINNFNYAMTGGQAGPTTPLEATLTTAPYGNYELPFNLPYLADACGAVYVARWTVYHVVQLTKAFKEALNKKGFSFIEVLSPCPTFYERRNKLGEAVDRMKFYRKESVIQNGANTKDIELGFQSKIVLGKFVDRERPVYMDVRDEQVAKRLKERFVKWQGVR